MEQFVLKLRKLICRVRRVKYWYVVKLENGRTRCVYANSLDPEQHKNCIASNDVSVDPIKKFISSEHFKSEVITQEEVTLQKQLLSDADKIAKELGF